VLLFPPAAEAGSGPAGRQPGETMLGVLGWFEIHGNTWSGMGAGKQAGACKGAILGTAGVATITALAVLDMLGALLGGHGVCFHSAQAVLCSAALQQ
jgi:hypothetical protein